MSAKVGPSAQEETPHFVPFTGSGARLDGRKPNAKQRAEVLCTPIACLLLLLLSLFLSFKALPSIGLHT